MPIIHIARTIAILHAATVDRATPLLRLPEACVLYGSTSKLRRRSGATVKSDFNTQSQFHQVSPVWYKRHCPPDCPQSQLLVLHWWIVDYLQQKIYKSIKMTGNYVDGEYVCHRGQDYADFCVDAGT